VDEDEEEEEVEEDEEGEEVEEDKEEVEVEENDEQKPVTPKANSKSKPKPKPKSKPKPKPKPKKPVTSKPKSKSQSKPKSKSKSNPKSQSKLKSKSKANTKLRSSKTQTSTSLIGEIEHLPSDAAESRDGLNHSENHGDAEAKDGGDSAVGVADQQKQQLPTSDADGAERSSILSSPQSGPADLYGQHDSEPSSTSPKISPKPQSRPAKRAKT